MMTVRRPPGFMPSMPFSNPGSARLYPYTNDTGAPRSSELMNFLPLWSTALLVIDPAGIADDREPAAPGFRAITDSLVRELDFAWCGVGRKRRQHAKHRHTREGNRSRDPICHDGKHGASLTKSCAVIR